MDDNALGQIRQQLDNELKSAGANVGIAYGAELYKAFETKGWFTKETFGALGTEAFPMQVIAYSRTHYAFVDSDVDDWAYKIGTAHGPQTRT